MRVTNREMGCDDGSCCNAGKAAVVTFATMLVGTDTLESVVADFDIKAGRRCI